MPLGNLPFSTALSSVRFSFRSDLKKCPLLNYAHALSCISITNKRVIVFFIVAVIYSLGCECENVLLPFASKVTV